jgi:hypothetical protein
LRVFLSQHHILCVWVQLLSAGFWNADRVGSIGSNC